MAKTRMKTTPTRMQKDALMASAATTVTVAMAGVQDVRKRLRQSAPKEPLCATSTIIVSAPKRTNSISSAASSMSHASDTHSAHSDSESPPPTTTTLPTTAAPPAATSAPRTLNNLLCKPSAAQIGALKNRKVYMITERCEEPGAEAVVGNSAAGSQKRKMYLIMEENSTDGGDGVDGAIDATKYLKSENGPKKLTLFADKSDVVLTQHFEKILPEILNRIQAKDGHINANAASLMRAITPPVPATATTPPLTVVTTATTAPKLHNGAAVTVVASCPDAASLQPRRDDVIVGNNNNKRLPITLPPKKNRTKIITTHINNISCNSNSNSATGSSNSSSDSTCNAANGTKIATNFSLPPVQIKQISAATPVIVSTASLPPTSSHAGVHIAANNNKYTHNGQTSTAPASVVQLAQPQKNINLSTDFLFLMKMLPKLESIPEPHKHNVKHYIEKIITQNANIFAPH